MDIMVMCDFCQLQNKYHQVLTTYINGSLFTRTDVLLSFLSSRLPPLMHSASAAKEFMSLGKAPPQLPTKAVDVSIDAYAGSNPYVLKMMDYLERNLKDDLYGAYVHGSLGTYEEIPYSDFDALVILKNDTVAHPRKLRHAAYRLERAKSIMYECDPLQHHGWFVLSERDLDFFPESYFSIQMFVNSKSLFPREGAHLSICLRESHHESMQAFKSLGESIVVQITKQHYPRNLYQLKSLLSRFMLLPSLYVQVRDRIGVFKKDSFELAKSDFSPSDWAVMEEASESRKSWVSSYSLKHRFPLLGNSILFRFLVKKYLNPIPENWHVILNHEFYRRMHTLVKQMIENIEKYDKLPSG